jgi:hypothetical protein
MYYLNLFGFGCSWAAGSGLLSQEHTYIELLAKRLNFQHCKNYAQESTSIPAMVLQLNQCIQQDTVNGSHAVFFLSGIDRDVVWDDKEPVHLSPTQTDPLAENWYKNFNSFALSEYRANTTILALQGMCRAAGIKDYYIWGWDTINLYPSVDTTRMFASGKASVADIFSNFSTDVTGLKNSGSKYIIPNDGHPSVVGHEKIADLLEELLTTY